MRYDGAALNKAFDNAWPHDLTNPDDWDHVHSPIAQAPVANLLGEPWYLESGSPGGDYVTWLNLPTGRLGFCPSVYGGTTEGIAWYIAVEHDNGETGPIEHDLPLTATPAEVVAWVHDFMKRHNLRVPGGA